MKPEPFQELENIPNYLLNVLLNNIIGITEMPELWRLRQSETWGDVRERLPEGFQPKMWSRFFPPSRCDTQFLRHAFENDFLNIYAEVEYCNLIQFWS